MRLCYLLNRSAADSERLALDLNYHQNTFSGSLDDFRHSCTYMTTMSQTKVSGL